MKKFIVILLAALIFLLPGCTNQGNGGNDDGDGKNENPVEEQEEIMKFDEYSLNTYIKPFWQRKIVYNETVMFVGKTDKAPLLYKAEEIISVRSYDLKTEYVRGVDYNYNEEENYIYLTSGTSCPYFEEDEYYPQTFVSGRTFACNRQGKDFLFFSEGSTICNRQLAVTYRHGGEDMLSVPEDCSAAFGNTIGKLRSGEETKILFYGDSITAGCNSSGVIGCEPYADSWTQMVFDSLVGKYGNDKSVYINSATGGWSTQDGYDHLQERVIAYAPDAVFIAFGMNDYTLTGKQHIAIIKAMVSEIRKSLPDTDICLITPMYPNPEAYGAYAQQYTFEEDYEEYVGELRENGTDNVALAKVTSYHREILGRKRYYDMTGNNVNHTNDFLARVYAQVVTRTVSGG
ncbi:MAG: SGNH/GDSL hydrolase family protein [Christensenellales bacterium]